MGSSLYTVRLRVTGATQFSAANPLVTFNEFTGLNALPPSWSARIVTIAYNSQGDAHTPTAVLRPPANTAPNADDQIVIFSPTTALNNVGNMCGPEGFVVPRQYGISDADTQPPVATIATAETYRLFFSTVGKTAPATVFVQYAIEEHLG